MSARLILFLVLALAAAILTNAVPLLVPRQQQPGPSEVLFSTTGLTNLPPYYQPPSKFETNLAMPNTNGMGFAASDAQEAAMNHFIKTMGMEEEDLDVVSHSPLSVGISAVYLTQMWNDIPIANAVANAVVDSSGAIISHSSSFVPDDIMQKAEAAQNSTQASFAAPADISPLDALASFCKAINITIDTSSLKIETVDNKTIVKDAKFALGDIEMSQKYYQTPTRLAKAWDISVNTGSAWYNAFVDTTSSEILGVVGFKSSKEFIYNVFFAQYRAIGNLHLSFRTT
jgi:hypothetical protein